MAVTVKLFFQGHSIGSVFGALLPIRLVLSAVPRVSAFPIFMSPKNWYLASCTLGNANCLTLRVATLSGNAHAVPALSRVPAGLSLPAVGAGLAPPGVVVAQHAAPCRAKILDSSQSMHVQQMLLAQAVPKNRFHLSKITLLTAIRYAHSLSPISRQHMLRKPPVHGSRFQSGKHMFVSKRVED